MPLETVQPVTFVPPSALTSLNATVLANTMDSTGVYANVDVVANAAAGAVYGAKCDWSIPDQSVTIQSQSSTSLEATAKSTTKFKLALPGTYSATCTIGAVSTSVSLTR